MPKAKAKAWLLILIITYTTCLEIPKAKTTRELEMTPAQKARKFIDPDFDTDQYIVVKNRDEWNNYLAHFIEDNRKEDSSVFRTVNPVLCYLAIRVFPLEYMDEIEKVFSRVRLSTNCGFMKDIVFLSPMNENDPYTMRKHPHNIVV